MIQTESISILFFGDIIGKPGRQLVKRFLKETSLQPDVVIANVENIAHGYGVTEAHIVELREAGVHAFTGGNHTFDRKEIFDFIDKQKDLIRPANYPSDTPGTGAIILDVKGHKLGVINVLGRVFMDPLQSPFSTIDLLLPKISEETKMIFVDMHAEATAEKIAMGWYLDGRVSVVVGTHTHVQTADERILPNGTAYITDVGCCGPYNGVIGMDRESVMRRLVKQLPTRLEVASGPAMVSGVFVTIGTKDGKAISIERVQFKED